MFLQNSFDGVNKKGKINRRKGVPRTRDTRGKELRSASIENELRFNLDDSAKQVLDEQKENGCKLGGYA